MKSLPLLCVIALLVGAAAQSEHGAGNLATNERFVGAWKLVSIEEPGADGQLHKADCDGMFVFTPDGKASVQVMYRNAESASAYAHSGYEASYGSYHIDDDSTFTFHVDGALVRTLIGTDLRRAYKISGDRLTIQSTNPNEHWRVIWERFSAAGT